MAMAGKVRCELSESNDFPWACYSPLSSAVDFLEMCGIGRKERPQSCLYLEPRQSSVPGGTATGRRPEEGVQGQLLAEGPGGPGLGSDSSPGGVGAPCSPRRGVRRLAMEERRFRPGCRDLEAGMWPQNSGAEGMQPMMGRRGWCEQWAPAALAPRLRRPSPCRGLGDTSKGRGVGMRIEPVYILPHLKLFLSKNCYRLQHETSVASGLYHATVARAAVDGGVSRL